MTQPLPPPRHIERLSHHHRVGAGLVSPAALHIAFEVGVEVGLFIRSSGGIADLEPHHRAASSESERISTPERCSLDPNALEPGAVGAPQVSYPPLVAFPVHLAVLAADAVCRHPKLAVLAPAYPKGPVESLWVPTIGHLSQDRRRALLRRQLGGLDLFPP